MKFSYKTEIKDDKYLVIQITETIIIEKQIVLVDDTIFKVLAINVEGYIKVSDGFRIYVCKNPFSKHIGKVYDIRSDYRVIATCTTEDKVFDMTNAIFDLSTEEMSRLYEDTFMKKPNNEFWVELK